MYTSACDCVFEPSRTIAWSVVFCTSTYQRYRHLTVADQAVSTWYIIRGATSALMMCCGIQSGTATSIAPTMRQQYSSSICCATIARCCVLPLVPHPICYLRPSFTYVLPPSTVVITQIRGHIAGYPPPHFGTRLAFLSRGEFSTFFPRRLASNWAYPR